MINILIAFKSNSLMEKKQIKTANSSEDIRILLTVMSLLDHEIIVPRMNETHNI